MNDDYTPDEIEAMIHSAFALQIQKPKSGLVALNSDGTNPAVQEWHLPVKVAGQEETYEAAYNPIIDLTALANGSPVDIILNDDGEYEAIGLNGGLGRAVYSGTIPTANLALRQHNHQNGVGGGQLNASLIFNAGATPAPYGGTGQSSYAVGDLLYASATDTLSKLADVTTGNVLLSGGVNTAPAYGKVGLATHVSGVLAEANGGTNQSTYAAGDLIYASAINTLAKLAAGTDGHVLTLASGLPTWAAASGGSSPFTYAAPVIYPNNTSDVLTIGGTSNIAKLGIVGATDQTQLYIIGHATQTEPLLNIENSIGQSLWVITPTVATIAVAVGITNAFTQINGAFSVNEVGGNFNAVFSGEHDANLLFLVASTDRVGIGDSTPDGRFAVVGRADEIQTIIRGNGTQTNNVLEIQNSSSAVLVSVSGLGGLVVNEQGADADSRFEGDNDASLLFLNAGTDRVGIGDTTPDGRFAVVGRANEVQTIIRGHSTQTSNILEVQTNTPSTLLSVANSGLVSGVKGVGLGITLDGMHAARTSSSSAITTKTSPGTLIASIVVPASTLNAGRQLRYTFHAFGSCANADNRLHLVVQDGSTDLMDVRTQTSNGALGNTRHIKGEALITCRTTGSSGTVWVSGGLESALFTDGGGGLNPNTATNTINTTTARTINIRLYLEGTGAPTLTIVNDHLDIAG